MKTGYDPGGEYRSRLEARKEDVRGLNRLYGRIAYARLGIALVSGIVLWLIFWRRALTPWWMLVPPLAFLTLMWAHSRIARRRDQLAQAVSHYDNGLARIEDRWIGRGEPGERFRDETHLYAADLDIFGRGSLFELLSTGRTKVSGETLAGWLSSPAGESEILERQAAVEELRPALDLREDIATLEPDLRSSIHLDRLTRWATAPLRLRSRWLGPAIPAFTAIMIGALVYSLVSGRSEIYYGVLLAGVAILFLTRKRVGDVLAGVDVPQRELDLASELIARLESEDFSAPRLKELDSKFGSPRASGEIRRLVRLVERQKSLKSADLPITVVILALTEMIVPFSLVVLLSLRTAAAIENWREAHGPDVEAWIRAAGEFESLLSLAGYAYEHPADPFPEVAGGQTVLVGDSMAHPLLPAAASVPNSVRLNETQRLIVVSGSNMSGKSTLLRTVGINTVLAMAGAPVRCGRLRVSPLAIGATLRIQDSLQTGTSRFYAEITRIRDIMKLTADDLPVLFLLDEVLHGTNSQDRAVGAGGIVRGLIEQGAIGLATTHDLALARVADALGGRAVNVHFEDRMENGRMVFDYKMKPGVIEKSNALELMRAVGLDV